ncbi:MAG: TIGR01458 family HAD-type hydrolase [Rhodospirillales bacterium CG15_BIG_FIL_POST_REV_8_21_14_020_66_15]|nr:MAG: TIGR01458 family HAD-type hydrolase [Rhodospirillales bacterium CG15_BIG_FIL_POST_REV_8_21_14_020_66_15]
MTTALKGILFDLEGVLYQGGAAVPGAAEALGRIRSEGLATRFLTNTTLRPSGAVWRRLRDMGMPVDADQIVTPAMAAVSHLRARGLRRVHLAAEQALAEDFREFDLVTRSPEAVVMGDLDAGFDRRRLSELTAMLLDGAELIALHKNRLWRPGGELIIDLGPYVAALEYAAGVEAVVLGKPSRDFFMRVLDDMRLVPDAAVMVGDDIDSDVAGAQAAGLRAVQVMTGKYDPRTADRAVPDALIASVADLPDAIAAWT